MPRIAIDPTFRATLPWPPEQSAVGCLKTVPHYNIKGYALVKSCGNGECTRP